jgi:hypothetical protein
MNPRLLACALLASAALAACDLRYAVMGLPPPEVTVAQLPLELEYREAKGGLIVLRGRVNGRLDVDFLLDTGAPVSVLIDGNRTRGLGLDSSRARHLGDRNNPATPIGDIQPGFDIAFGTLRLTQLTAVVIPQNTLPCREKFDEIGFGGVIGADLFRRFVVEVDTSTRRIRLHDPKAWSAPADSVSLPLTFKGGHPFVETQVKLGDGQVLDAVMNVDTGMNRALTLVAGSHPAIAMPTDGVPRASCYVNGVRDEREGPPAVVVLRGKPFEVSVPIYSAALNAIDGLRTSTIGVGLFKDRRLAIDYPGSRIVLM